MTTGGSSNVQPSGAPIPAIIECRTWAEAMAMVPSSVAHARVYRLRDRGRWAAQIYVNATLTSVVWSWRR